MPKLSRRLLCLAAVLAQYDFDVIYLAGKENTILDPLPRWPERAR